MLNLLTLVSIVPDFSWFKTINQIIQTVKTGLLATGRVDVWNLKWPGQSVNSQTPFMSSIKTYSITAEIINAEGKSIGSQIFPISCGWHFDNDQKSKMNNVVLSLEFAFFREITFPAVDANLITDSLTIQISAIDGVPAKTVALQKRLNIVPEDEYNRISNVQNNGVDTVNVAQFTIEDGMVALYTGSRKHIVIPYGASYIGQFRNKQVASVFIPNTVTTIGGWAFSDHQLESIDIPKSVTKIEYAAFNGNQLTNVVIPHSVVEIGNQAFGGNKSTNFTLPANVEFGGLYPFDYELKEFYENNGKKAGTYTRYGSQWSYSKQ